MIFGHAPPKIQSAHTRQGLSYELPFSAGAGYNILLAAFPRDRNKPLLPKDIETSGVRVPVFMSGPTTVSVTGELETVKVDDYPMFSRLV